MVSLFYNKAKKLFFLRIFLLSVIGMAMSENRIFKKQLDNGLTILVMPRHHVPKVSAQIWYNVGSKHEKDGEKGMAHLIEHMVFKGTERLSESDISAITNKLSGSCNAFTSYDYTGYLFDLPTQHWEQALDIFADCMSNCTFKQEHLNSELKAVIQELKMYKDNYARALIEDLIGVVFAGHPYGYPIIGYKHDLWNLDSAKLKVFYHKHYVPNNATLVLVGDVIPDEAFKKAEQYFGKIPARKVEKPSDFYLEQDLHAKSITLYRDVKQPVVTYAFTVPGSWYKTDYVLHIMSWLVGTGRGSRLHKRLVEELDLATSVGAFSYDMFEHGAFLLRIQPKDINKVSEILVQVKIILQEIIEKGFSDIEFERAQAQTNAEILNLFESNQDLAGALGHLYLATGDENYLLNYQGMSLPELKAGIKALVENCFRPELMHTGLVLPMQEKDKGYWQKLQDRSDEEDKKVLEGKTRSVGLESGSLVDAIQPKDPVDFKYPKYETFTLKNGVEVLYAHDERVPKIEVALEFKANHFYDPEDKAGLNNFVSHMLLKGTQKYSAIELAELIERKGMGASASPGYFLMSMLQKDAKQGFEILNDILTDSIFKEEAVEQVRSKILNDIVEYWDQPYSFVNDLVASRLYKGHPYSKNSLGSVETVKNISRDDLVEFFKKYISPRGTRLALVGDLSGINLQELLEGTIGRWEGSDVAEISYPSLVDVKGEEVTHYINRDQVVLSFAGLSIDRKNPDYDKLLLFDHVFGDGAGMSSRLFQVRERTGLFYRINGSLLARTGKQPGMTFVKTLVSMDRLKEAEKEIGAAITSAAETLSETELAEARRNLINSMVDHFESYKNMVSTFLYLRRYDLPRDYFDKRVEQLNECDLNSVKDAAQKYLDISKMLKVKVGRIS